MVIQLNDILSTEWRKIVTWAKCDRKFIINLAGLIGNQLTIWLISLLNLLICNIESSYAGESMRAQFLPLAYYSFNFA